MHGTTNIKFKELQVINMACDDDCEWSIWKDFKEVRKSILTF